MSKKLPFTAGLFHNKRKEATDAMEEKEQSSHNKIQRSFPSNCKFNVTNSNYVAVNIYDDTMDKILQINSLQQENATSFETRTKLENEIFEMEQKISEMTTTTDSKLDKKQIAAMKKTIKTLISDREKLIKQKDRLKSSHQITIYIDNREGRNNDLFTWFDKLNLGIVVKANLVCLDFIIVLNNKFGYGFERKRLDDAVSSTQTSHYGAQNCKMKHLFTAHIGTERSRIVNILEKIRLQSDQPECKHSAEIGQQHHLTLTDLNIMILKRAASLGRKSDEEQIQNLLQGINNLMANTKESKSDEKKCKDDLMWIHSEPNSFEGLSFDRNRILGIPINRILKEGFNTIISESDVYTAYWLLKFMLSMLKMADELSEKWKNQPDFDLDQIKKAEDDLTGEPLREWLDTRELPKDSTAGIPDELCFNAQQRQFALQLLVLKNVTIDFVVEMVQRWPTPAQFGLFMQNENAQEVVDELAAICPRDRKFGFARAIALYNHFFGSNYGVDKKGKVIAAISSLTIAEDDELLLEDD
jgi:hypothetical protein